MLVIFLAVIEDIIVQAAALAPLLAPTQAIVKRRRSVPSLPGSGAGHL